MSNTHDHHQHHQAELARPEHDHAMHEHSGHDHEMHDHSDHSSHDHAGHGGHGGHAAHFRRLFWIMLVLALPVVAFSPMFAMLLGYELPDNLLVTAISPVLGTVMFVWGGAPFLTGGLGEIRSRQPGMMLLIALAIGVAFVSSWGATLGLLDHQLDFWWELALLIVIMLLGHWIEMRSPRPRARSTASPPCCPTRQSGWMPMVPS
jgi:Cu2+-exporting ATPase